MYRPLNVAWLVLGFALVNQAGADELSTNTSATSALRGNTHVAINGAVVSDPWEDYFDPGLASSPAPCGEVCGEACSTDCACDCPTDCNDGLFTHLHHAPGNLVPHTPYCAEPKLYYYFRPYNWRHIPDQIESVLSFGGDPRHPYANREFEGIYEGLE